SWSLWVRGLRTVNSNSPETSANTSTLTHNDTPKPATTAAASAPRANMRSTRSKLSISAIASTAPSPIHTTHGSSANHCCTSKSPGPLPVGDPSRGEAAVMVLKFEAHAECVAERGRIYGLVNRAADHGMTDPQ